MPDESSGAAATGEKPNYVYSLHGIRTNAYWQSELSDEIRAKTGFEVGHRNYLRFDTAMFVFKNIFSDKPLRLIEGDIRDFQKRYRVSVIAHSFGTWLLLKALSENSDLRVHHLILCGAIFPRALSRWRQLKQNSHQISGEIVNFCGARDPFPALAELLSRDFGASGVTGAGDPTIKDSFHDVGHSGFLTRAFCGSYWIDILTSKPYLPQPATLKPLAYIRFLLWASAHRGLLLLILLSAMLGAYQFHRSEWSCYIRSCYVDVVRIHNFSSSTRMNKSARSYVDLVTFEYTYNFDRTELLFRAPRDRNPVVTSLVGDNLSPIPPQESAETLNTGTDASDRQIQVFRIPVRDRRANFSVEFANDSQEGPEGIEVFADRIIRNLRVQIFMPTDALMIPTKGEFRKGILINRKPRGDLSEKNCMADSDGKQLRCTDLYVPRSTGFFYCFSVQNWKHQGEVQAISVDGCKPEAISTKQ
jgi:hypothetical protein